MPELSFRLDDLSDPRIAAFLGEHLDDMRAVSPPESQEVATAILSRLLEEARSLGWRRVSLETGSQPFFEPARALYRRHGFELCGPFEGYQLDPIRAVCS